MDIRPLDTEADYDWALAEIAAYFAHEPAPGTPEAARFGVLAALIENYEAKHWPIEPPDPVEAIRSRMEQAGYGQADLARLLGSRSLSNRCTISKDIRSRQIRKKGIVLGGWRLRTASCRNARRLYPPLIEHWRRGVTVTNPLPKLELPRRWELLQLKACEVDIDPIEVVERVDDAAEQVDALLRRVRTGGGGLIEVVFGLSGSGKTTFLKTLSKFFENVRLSSFPDSEPIARLPDFIRSGYVSTDSAQRIILIERRDNPKSIDLDSVEEMLADLLEVFREPAGAAVVLWPITNPQSAALVAKTAWEVGRDSMVDSKSKGQFHFKGLPRERYYELADNTSRTLTGDGLEAFGITPKNAQELLAPCQTISDFFARADDAADHIRDSTWSVLRARVRTHLWVVLPGDDIKIMNATASALTQGTRSRIDVDLIGEFIDRPENTSIYVADWRERRGSLAHLLRAVDLRLFSFPPNVSLAAIRSFGTNEVKSKLKQQNTNLDASKQAMRSSRLYKAILTEAGIKTAPHAGSRDIAPETVNEFLRVQRLASNPSYSPSACC